jgi:hypothetical protein
MKNVVFWDITSCGSCKNRTEARWEEIQLLITANVPISPIIVTLMMVALHSSKTLARTRPTRRKISEDGILHSHRREKLKSYLALTG